VGAEEMRAEELFGLDVAGAGGPARTDGGEFARVFVGPGAAELLGLGGEGREEGESDEED